MSSDISVCQRKNILILIPSLNGGGAERVLINILKNVDYSIYKIDLCVVLRRGVYLHEVPDNVNVIYLLNSLFVLRLLVYIQKKYSNVLIFKKLIKNKLHGVYDVAISYIDSNYSDLLYLLPNIKKKVAWSHASYETNNDYFKYYKCEKYRRMLKTERYAGLDVIVFVSYDSMREFVSLFGSFRDMRVIYNYVDVASIIKKAVAYEVRKAEVFEFIAIGRLVSVKGYDRLIRVAKRLKDKNYKFKIRIIGDGPLKGVLQGQIISNHITQHVELCGYINNPYPFLKSADVFVMTSVSEALPTALCEAFVLGKPVVVTKCSGCSELVDNGNYGVIVEQNDDSLFNALSMLIDNKEKLVYYTERSVKRSVIFNDDIIKEKYYEIFDL